MLIYIIYNILFYQKIIFNNNFKSNKFNIKVFIFENIFIFNTNILLDY